MTPTDSEIVKRLERTVGWLETTIEKQLLPMVKAMLLEARADALEIVLAAPSSDLMTTAELELNHYRRELAALGTEGK